MAGRLASILSKDRNYSTGFGIQPAEQPTTPSDPKSPTQPVRNKPKTTAAPSATRPSRARSRLAKTADSGSKSVFLRLSIPEQMAERALATGYAPEDVFRKAWQGIAGRPLKPEFEPHTIASSPGSASLRVKVTVPESILKTIAAEADPLGVKGSAFLLRGQAERRLHEALRVLLDELGSCSGASGTAKD